MSRHAIRWTFDRDAVTAEAICNEPPGADCRLASVSCECETWGEIWRKDDGTIWHKIFDYGESIEPVWHEVKPADYCNVCLFINESGCVPELGSGTWTIAETPIRPVWVDGGCDWERDDEADTHPCHVTDCGNRRCQDCDERMTCHGPEPRPCGEVCTDCPCGHYECRNHDADIAEDAAEQLAFSDGRDS